jgi:hypothetical protein
MEGVRLVIPVVHDQSWAEMRGLKIMYVERGHLETGRVLTMPN